MSLFNARWIDIVQQWHKHPKNVKIIKKNYQGMFLLVMAFSFLAAQIVSKQVNTNIIDVILIKIIEVILIKIIKVCSSDSLKPLK